MDRRPALLLALVRAAARLAPPSARGDWGREWTAEVLHRWTWLERRGRLDAVARLDLLLRVLGGFTDALAVRRLAAGDAALTRGPQRAMEAARGALAAAVLAVALALDAVGLAVAARTEAPVPPPLAAFGLVMAASLLAAAAGAARGLLSYETEHFAPAIARPRVLAARDDSADTPRRLHRVLGTGVGAGVLLTALAATRPVGGGAADVLGGSLAAVVPAFVVCAGVAAWLVLRGEPSPRALCRIGASRPSTRQGE